MFLHVLRIPILTQTLLLVSAYPATVRSAHADDRWQFTRAELAQCQRIELDPDRHPFSMILPRNAVSRGSWIVVGNNPGYLQLERRDLVKPLSVMRQLAIQSGYQIVVSDDQVLIVDRGPNLGHYLYCYHPDRAVMAGQIKSREDCLFRAKCAMSLRSLKPGPDSKTDSNSGSKTDTRGTPLSDAPQTATEGHLPSASPDVKEAAVAREDGKPRADTPHVKPQPTFAGQLLQSIHERMRQQRADNAEAPDAVPPNNAADRQGGSISVNGIERQRVLIANDEDLRVSGIRNEVIVSGTCRHVSVSGVGNRVIVEQAARISVSGVENVVQYVRGSAAKAPQLPDGSGNNKIDRIDALPKTP